MEFIDKFNSRYEPVTESGCWIWTAACSSAGYGQIYKDGKVQYAHRISYEINVGEVKNGLYVCHKCDNPSCVNPNHLFLGSHTENMRDMFNKKRRKTTVWGEKHGMSKLTDDDVKSIRSDNRANRVIAKDYGIDPSNVSMIKLNKTWKHVKD